MISRVLDVNFSAIDFFFFTLFKVDAFILEFEISFADKMSHSSTTT